MTSDGKLVTVTLCNLLAEMLFTFKKCVQRNMRTVLNIKFEASDELIF